MPLFCISISKARAWKNTRLESDNVLISSEVGCGRVKWMRRILDVDGTLRMTFDTASSGMDNHE